ncbi:MAG: hypothetical protein IT433_11700 [Phycisphaerales bacterium]|nr:hypothetical protein [Phycisphaerales bacterium]
MPTTIRRPSPRLYANAVLTVIAGVLVLNWLATPSDLLGRANAQPADDIELVTDDPSGRISAAEQRKQMIQELRGLSARMERIESALTRGINVKVTDMPAMKQAADKPAK